MAGSRLVEGRQIGQSITTTKHIDWPLDHGSGPCEWRLAAVHERRRRRCTWASVSDAQRKAGNKILFLFFLLHAPRGDNYMYIYISNLNPNSLLFIHNYFSFSHLNSQKLKQFLQIIIKLPNPPIPT